MCVFCRVAVLRTASQQVEQELSDICASILSLLDEFLIPTASTGESKVFYLKMKGDYHRYLAGLSVCQVCLSVRTARSTFCNTEEEEQERGEESSASF